MATTAVKPGDMTGKARQDLAKEAAAALKEREGEIALSQSLERERNQNEVVDYSEGPSQAPTLTIDEVEIITPDLTEEFDIIRVVEDIEDMTFGAGNLYTFRVGQKYRVPTALANHLDEKGYLYSR